MHGEVVAQGKKSKIILHEGGRGLNENNNFSLYEWGKNNPI